MATPPPASEPGSNEVLTAEPAEQPQAAAPVPAAAPEAKLKIVLPPEDQAVSPARPAVVRALPMSELEKEGVGLTNLVLWLIAGLAVIILAMVAKSEFDDVPAEVAALQRILESIATNPSPPSAETMEKVLQAMQKLTDSRQAARAFWKEVLQTILVNIFLPVLTSILGYIFGTSRNTSNGSGRGS